MPVRLGVAMTVLWITGLVALVAVVAIALAGADGGPALAALPAEDPAIARLAAIAEAASTIAAIAVVAGLVSVGLLLAEPGQPLTSPARGMVPAVAGFGLWWACSAMITGFLVFARAVALPLGEVLQPTALWSFATDTTLGRTFLLQVLAALVIAITAPVLRRTRGANLLLVLALLAIAAQGFAGHGLTAADHAGATILLAAHITGVSLWVGGIAIAALAALGWGGNPAPHAWQRLSALALWSVTIVGVTGILQALLRPSVLQAPLGNPYGVLLLAKAMLLAVLIGIGWAQRARALPRYATGDRRAFGMLVIIEIIVMAVVIGLSVALAATSPVVAADEAVIVEVSHATGHGLPLIPQSGAEALGAWRIDAVVLLIAALSMAGYAIGAKHLCDMGMPTPRWRIMSFGTGIVVMVVLACTGIGTYARVLAGLAIAQQVCWLTLVPTLLMAGSPWAHLRAAFEAIGVSQAPETTERFGRPSWFISTGAIVATGTLLLALYATPLAGAFLWIPWGGNAIDIALLALGAVIAATIVGWDGQAPSPGWGPALSTAALIGCLLVAAMARGELIAGGYFGFFTPPYAADLIAQQREGFLASIGVLLLWLAYLGLVATRLSRCPVPLRVRL